MSFIHLCTDTADYNGAFKLTLSGISTGTTAQTLVYPAYLTKITIIDRSEVKEELRLNDLGNSLNDPRRFWDFYYLNVGGTVTLAGFFIASTEAANKLEYRRMGLAVDGLTFKSLTILSSATDAQTMTFNDCSIVSSAVAAGSINGMTVLSGSITYAFATIT